MPTSTKENENNKEHTARLEEEEIKKYLEIASRGVKIRDFRFTNGYENPKSFSLRPRTASKRKNQTDKEQME